MNTYLFEAKTEEAFVIKVLGELLNSTLNLAPFRINDQGIFLLEQDLRKEQLIDIQLRSEDFQFYKCKRPINFSVNTSHLYRMLKSIKKKDSVKIFIEEFEGELRLGIYVEQSDAKNNKIVKYIHINLTDIEDIIRPGIEEDGPTYERPINMSSKEFQKMKNLHNISKHINITSKLNYIRFFCDGGDVYSTEIIIGNENDEENRNVTTFFKQDFYTQHITGLIKCAGQSGTVKIFVHDDLGLKIHMKAGSLGDITIYIKSLELIKEDEEQKCLTAMSKHSYPYGDNAQDSEDSSDDEKSASQPQTSDKKNRSKKQAGK